MLLRSDHLASTAVSGGVGDLVDLKAIEKFAFLFLDAEITELIVDEKGVVLGGLYPKIDDHDPGIAIDQQMTCAIAMEQSHLMT